jgi:hypothetical protein
MCTEESDLEMGPQMLGMSEFETKIASVTSFPPHLDDI